MNEGLIPARYAKALYMVACEKNCDTKLYETMKTLEHSFSRQSSLQAVLGNPFVSDNDKKESLMTAAGTSVEGESLFVDFLKLLAQNRRMDMARGIADAYISLYRLKHKIYEVKVVSAASMDEDEQRRLRDLISRHLDGGVMEYSTSVDPSLIGGFTVSIGNERIDASISNELKQLRLNLISK